MVDQQQPPPPLPAYALSLSLLSDGEPVRSLCHVPGASAAAAAAAAPPPPPTDEGAKSTAGDEHEGGVTSGTGGSGGAEHLHASPLSYELIAGSQSGVLTAHSLSSPAEASRTAVATTVQPGGDGTRHPHQITALLSIPADAGFGDALAGGYVSGCRDSTVRVFGPDHGLVNELRGHTNAVTSLSWLDLVDLGGGGGGGGPTRPPATPAAPPLLISGSWDGSAKLWNVLTGACLATMGGHENTVGVVGLPPPVASSGAAAGAAADGEAAASAGGGGWAGRLATTSAGTAEGSAVRNHRVRIFTVTLPTLNSPVARAALAHTVSDDHGGPIRCAAYDPGTDRILTASNDGTVKLRDGGTGECTATLAHPGTAGGHPPMLLSVAVLGPGRYVATSEDGSAVVWDMDTGGAVGGGGEPPAFHGGEPQVLDHPGCVWAVLPLPSRSGGGFADFVTACQDGQARIWTLDPARVAPPDEIQALRTAVSESRAKTSSGPSAEEIAKLPKWEMASLTQGRSEGQVQVFNKAGRAIAAQWSATSGTWIEVGEVTGSNQNAGSINGVRYDHVFPIEIDVAGGGVQKLRIGYNNGDNPFVVAQAFIDQYELDQNYLAQIADYLRSRAGEEGPTISAEAGAGAAGAGGGPPPPAATAAAHSGPVPMDVSPPASQYAHLPMRGYKAFAIGTEPKSLGRVVAKIREFNSTLTTNLTDAEVGKTLDDLCSTLSATSRYHATTISDGELKALGRMVKHWDAERAFPALDLARLAVLHPDGSRTDREAYWTEIIGLALDKCRVVREEGLTGTAAVAVPMLTMRLCANCFKGGSGSSEAVAGQLKSVLDCAESFATSSNKNVRLSVATVVLNASSCMMSRGGSRMGSGHDDSSSDPSQILSVVGTIVGSGLYETEATVRALVALGTALLADDIGAGRGGGETTMTAKEKANSLHMESMVQHAGSQHGDKAKAVAEEIRLILKG